MIRAVLDSNTLLSGFLTTTTPPGQIIDAWRAGRFELAISDAILGETLRHLTTDRYFRRRLTAQQIARYIDLLLQRADPTPITVSITGVATHPEDDRILEAAVSAQVDYLVTGDIQLRRLATYQGVQIVSPREFLDVLSQLST